MILADGENDLAHFFLKKIPQEGKFHIFVIYGKQLPLDVGSASGFCFCYVDQEEGYIDTKS